LHVYYRKTLAVSLKELHYSLLLWKSRELEVCSMKKLVLLVCLSAAGLMAQAPAILGVFNAPLEAEGIVNTSLCPGALATIYGSGFGSGAPTSVVVLVGGQRAFVIAVAPTQVNVQLPFNAPVGATTVVITTGGGTSAPFDVTLTAVAPTIALANGSTTNGLFVTLKSTFVSSTNLPNPGDTLVLYASGLGPTNPAAPVSGLATANLPTATLPTLTVGGVAATVLYAGIASGSAALYQVNFTVPKTVQGNVPVVLSIGGQSSNSVILPLFGISAVVNAASFLNTGTAAPEEMISIFANGLGSTNQLYGFPATTVEGVSVTINGVAAPITALAATGNQINLVVPSQTPTTGTVQVALTTPTGTSIDFPLIMNAAVPGIFLVTDSANPTADIAVAQFANTVWLVMPTSAATALQLPQNCTASSANPLSLCGQPAAPGDYLVLYTTGLGEVTPNGDPNGTPLATGVIAPVSGSPLYETTATPTVQVGGVTATVLFSGVAPGTSGEYQVDFQVPTGVTEGDAVPLTVSMPGSTTATATLAVHSR
jgi:uncharacterized protein (TIGR03437 family)